MATNQVKETKIVTSSKETQELYEELIAHEYSYCVLPHGYFDFLNHLRAAGKDKFTCVSLGAEDTPIQ